MRELKDAGVEVYFEKENIYTFDSKGELLITIMSSLAQEESRSISENVTWGHRRRFAQSKALIPYKSLLGYTKNADGALVIVENEAPVVRRIYADFLALIQKTFTVDFLSKKVKKNEGEIPQYYVTGHHEAIIDPALWDRVQSELRQRSGRYVSRTHPFTKMIYCADCGGSSDARPGTRTPSTNDTSGAAITNTNAAKPHAPHHT